MATRVSPLLIRSVDVLDVREGGIARRQDLLLEDGLIRRIATGGGLEPMGIDVIDGTGLLAMPGLIDCHAHVHGTFVMGAGGFSDMGWIFQQVARNLRNHLLGGVTTVRDMGGPIHMLRWWGRRIASGSVPGPRLYCAGPILSVPGGYPTFTRKLPRLVGALIGQVKEEVPDALSAYKMVDTLVKKGVDLIKVAYSSRDYDADLSPLPVWPQKTLHSLIDVAHRRQRKVAVHVAWLKDLVEIMSMGIDSIEHVVRDGVMDEYVLDALAESGSVVVPTISILMNFFHLDRLGGFLQGAGGHACLEDIPRLHLLRLAERRRCGQDPPQLGDLKFADAESYARQNLQALIDNEIPLALGTDAGAFYSFFGDIASELRWLVEHGMTPLQAIQCGTLYAAELLDLEGMAGVIEESAWADLILVNGDPREDIGVMRSPKWVVAAGRPHKVHGTYHGAGGIHFADWN